MIHATLLCVCVKDCFIADLAVVCQQVFTFTEYVISFAYVECGGESQHWEENKRALKN